MRHFKKVLIKLEIPAVACFNSVDVGSQVAIVHGSNRAHTYLRSLDRLPFERKNSSIHRNILRQCDVNTATLHCLEHRKPLSSMPIRRDEELGAKRPLARF